MPPWTIFPSLRLIPPCEGWNGHPLPLDSCPVSMCVHAQSVQLCLTLCNPTDCSLPSSSLWGFFRQEYWSGLPCPPPGNLSDAGIEPRSPALHADSFLLSHRGREACFVSMVTPKNTSSKISEKIGCLAWVFDNFMMRVVGRSCIRVGSSQERGFSTRRRRQ